MSPMSTTAAIYTRVSLDAQDDHLAVDRQRADCQRIAQDRGWTVAGVYEDNSVSASKRDVTREQYERLILDYEAGKFDALICWDLDRLTRQPRQLEDWIDRAEQRGLKLVTANGEADLTTDGGRMYARIKAAVARAEAERKGARQKRANAQRTIEHGDVYGRRKSWGWLDVKCRIVDEAAAALIRQAVADVLAGKSTREVAAEWNAAGVMAPGGKPWLSTTVRTTLLRPQNAGIVAYKDQEYRDVPALWTPLFDVQTYDALKAELKVRSFSTPTRPSAPRRYLLGGLARCANCGSTMQGTVQKSGVNYMCSGRTHGCYRAVRVTVADEIAVNHAVVELLFHGAEAYLPTEHVERLQRIGKELDTIASERQEVTDAALSISSRIALLQNLDSREQALRAESADLTKDSAIASLIRELTELDLNAPDTEINDLIQTVKTRFLKLSLRQQRMLVTEFGRYEVLGRGEGPQRVRVAR